MSEYKQFALDLAHKAGSIIKKNFTLGMTRQWKSDTTPVTETDIKINTMLLQGVAKQFPGHSVLAEEESNLHKGSEYTWVCDPVDGTIPFSHGMPICTFSLALTKNGESILGVAYDPFGDRLAVAEKGKGAYLNNKPMKVSLATDFKGTVGDFEFFRSAPFDISKIGFVLEIEHNARMSKLCSFVYASILVAAGELAFGIFPGKTAHDIAAVKVIVEEAGGMVTNLFGEEQRYDQDIQGAIISNGILHERLVQLSKKLVVRQNA